MPERTVAGTDARPRATLGGRLAARRARCFVGRETERQLFEAINRQLAGWANFDQYADYTAMVYQHVDRVVFWKLAHWLARKYKTSIPSLMQ